MLNGDRPRHRGKTPRSGILNAVLLVGALSIAGCANFTGIAPGTPADSVEASQGKPFRVWPEPGGGTSWEYPLGPEGRHTYMVRLGADRRVTGVDQVLGWEAFSRITNGMPIGDVEHMLGRPYSKVTYPLLRQTAWSWRFVDTVWNRCFFAYVGPEGKVASIGSKDEESADMGIVGGVPC